MKKLDIGIILICTIVLPSIASRIILCKLSNMNYLIKSEVWLEITKVLLGVWGTLLGFIVTALSIILAIGNSPFLKLLNDSGHIKTIMWSYAITSLVLFAATAFGIYIICFNDFNSLLLRIMIFFIFSTMLSLVISLFFLFTIIFNSNIQGKK